jgi:hypothetical protein
MTGVDVGTAAAGSPFRRGPYQAPTTTRASNFLHRAAVNAVITVLAVAGCGQSAAPTPSASQSAAPSAQLTDPASATPIASVDIASSITLVDFDASSDPSAAAEREQELVSQLREDAGMAALIGVNGEAAFAELDALTDAFAQELILEIAAVIDAGGIPQGTSSLGALASIGSAPNEGTLPMNVIDVSLFADTGFTASTIMSIYSTIVQRAAESQSGTVPRQDSVDQTSNGLRQQVDVSTTFTVETGGGRVSADVIMSATDRITDAATGSFVALYTSRSTGHFDVNACPDENGVAEGTYTFETKHELNDVSGAQAARSGSGRAVNAPFRLIDGPNAHLVQIEARLDMQADGRGPGSPAGPGPTTAFDWGAKQQVQVVMPATGSTSATGTGLTVTGTGGERAAGAMLLSSAMAQLFLGQVAREAETFWRSGECITVETTEESRTVSPGETVEFDATAKGRFDGQEIVAPISGSFSGVDSLDPADSPQDPPATLTFTAGDEIDDKGIINLEQVGVRGIGKKTLEFTVGPIDYRWDQTAPGLGGLSGMKCDGKEGLWTVNLAGPGGNGSYTFTLTADSDTAQANADYFVGSGDGSAHWVMTGPVTFTDGDPPTLVFGTFTGTTTARIAGQTITLPAESAGFDIPLEQGDFCD